MKFGWRLLRLSPVVEAADLLRYVGLRDRLRCPRCKAVGTFKPHGARYDRTHYNDRPVHRWLCKWCGLYLGPEGEMEAWPDRVVGYWVIDGDRGPRPSDVLIEQMGRTWPWRG